jgi:glycosyltransferase involved in cell wall biosynthesis
MIIAVDARELVPNRMTGIRRHLETLLVNLSVKAPDWGVRLLVNQHCEKPSFPGNVEYLDHPEGITWFWDQFVLKRLIRRVNADVFYSPYYKIPFGAGCKTICTIHDVMELALGEYRRERGWLHTMAYAARIRKCLRYADAVTCDSEFTRKELVRLFNDPGEKLKTALLDCLPSPAVSKAPGLVLAKYGVVAPFILYMGNFKSHKNILSLIAAHESLSGGQGPFPMLVLAGGGGDRDGIVRERAKASSGRVVVAPRVNEEEAGALYRKASLFVMPSLYEGFGYPVIEAFHHGVPVCCSTATSLPEVAGDAACFFDPLDVQACAAAMQKALADGPYRDGLIVRGKGQARKFTSAGFCDAFIGIVRGLADVNR